MLAIVTPAAERSLLTPEELREAAGLDPSDQTQDAKLLALGRQVSDLIASECGVAKAGASIPTLRKERVVETLRPRRCAGELILARRFVSSIVSVVECDSALTSENYELNFDAGMLQRLRNGRDGHWPAGRILVTYDAGFDEVPGDLVLATKLAVSECWLAAGRDPLTKREDVAGVGETEYWVGGLPVSPGSAFSPTVAEKLAAYRTAPVA